MTDLDNLFSAKMTRRGSFLAIALLVTSCAKGPQINPNDGVKPPMKGGTNLTAGQLYDRSKVKKNPEGLILTALLFEEDGFGHIRTAENGKAYLLGVVTDKYIDKALGEKKPTNKIRLFARRVTIDELDENVPIFSEPCFTVAQAYQIRKELDKLAPLYEPFYKWNQSQTEKIPAEMTGQLTAMKTIAQERLSDAKRDNIELDPLMKISPEEIREVFNKIEQSSFFGRPTNSTLQGIQTKGITP